MAMPATQSEKTDRGQPIRGGVVTWACWPGFPPSAIFPFTPPERIGVRNLSDFQALMYRPLYWFGKDGKPEVDYSLSLALPPEWSEDGRTVTVTLKPWRWSDGEPICADNVLFFVNMMAVKGSRYGKYSPGYFPDNLTSYEKVADDKVRFTFDRVYAKQWVLMNQLGLITPMPKAWDRTADGPAGASANLADIPAVYDYLVEQNGDWTKETNEDRVRWAESPVWSVVSGPWRLKEYTMDGVVTFVPNEHYSGPNKPYLDEFRQVPTYSDEEAYRLLQNGPDSGNGVQVGFLPYGFTSGAPGEAAANPFAEKYTLIPQTTYCVRYATINFTHQGLPGRLLARTYVRQALQLCLDQERAVREIYLGHAYPTPGPVPLMPDSPLISPKLKQRNPLAFDVGRARRLLADNGWDVSTTPAVCVRGGAGPGNAGEGIEPGDRLSFRFRYVEGRPVLAQLMRQFAGDAAKAGIELRLEEQYASALIGEEHVNDRPRLQWELSNWHGGWVYEFYPTGEAIFQTGATSNWGAFRDPRADELITRTVTSDEPDAMYEYQEYVAEQVPVLWMPSFPLRLLEVAHNLRGCEPINPCGMINPENWYYVAE
jgi:peptide/nickel transport system substrate-binding protein